MDARLNFEPVYVSRSRNLIERLEKAYIEHNHESAKTLIAQIASSQGAEHSIMLPPALLLTVKYIKCTDFRTLVTSARDMHRRHEKQPYSINEEVCDAILQIPDMLKTLLFISVAKEFATYSYESMCARLVNSRSIKAVKKKIVGCIKNEEGYFEAVALCIAALDKTTVIGKILFTQAGINPCSETSGSLGTVLNHYEKLLLPSMDSHRLRGVYDFRLYNAARKGQISTVKKMLAKGANINFINPNTKTSVLRVAAENKKVEAEKFLLSQGANVDVEMNAEIPYSYAEFGDKKLYATIHEFNRELQLGEFNSVFTLVENDFIINLTDSSGSLLCKAVLCGNTKVVSYLLANKANPLLTDKSGFNPLFLAILNRSLECVRLLAPALRESMLNTTHSQLVEILGGRYNPRLFMNVFNSYDVQFSCLQFAELIGHKGIIRFLRRNLAPIVTPKVGGDFSIFSRNIAGVISSHLQVHDLGNLAQSCTTTHRLFTPFIDIKAAIMLAVDVINNSEAGVREALRLRLNLLCVRVSFTDDRGTKWEGMTAYEIALACGNAGLAKIIGNNLIELPGGAEMKASVDRHYAPLIDQAFRDESLPLVSLFNCVTQSTVTTIRATIKNKTETSGALADELAAFKVYLQPKIVNHTMQFTHYQSLCAAIKMLEEAPKRVGWNQFASQLIMEQVIAPLRRLLPVCDRNVTNNHFAALCQIKYNQLVTVCTQPIVKLENKLAR